MATTEESAAVWEETELKKELQRVVKTILEEDDIGLTTIEATRLLCNLAELKLKQTVGLRLDDKVLLEKFKRPLSDEIMGDPVVLGSG
ncbi:hypothetical protein QQP08_015352 [Theobroma cacao]|nr:hypothetical protein QQP08_015352 [Theobroma cacao]